MLLHGGIGTHTRRCLGQTLFREIVFALLEVGPAERVQIGAAVRLDGQSLFDVVQRFVELYAAVGIHVAEIVEGGSALRCNGQDLSELSFGLFVFLLPLVGIAAQEVNVLFLFRLGGQL